MSTNTLLRGSLIAAFGFAGLAMTAEAQLRYGNVHNYESGHCGNACVPGGAVQTNASRYGQGVQQPAFSQRQFYSQPSFPVSPGPVYVDCRATGTCTPQPTTVYTHQAQPSQRLRVAMGLHLALDQQARFRLNVQQGQRRNQMEPAWSQVSHL